MMDWSKRGYINIPALVITIQCNTHVVHVAGRLEVQQIRFLSHWDAYNVFSLEAVAYSSYYNTVE